MDQATIRYATAAAIILAAVTLGVSAFAESAQYQRPSSPVDPNARLPGVIQLEQLLNKNGVTSLNTLKGQPAHAAPSQPAQPQAEPVVLTAPAPSAASNPPAAAPPRRETPLDPANRPMIRIAAPAFADAPPNIDGQPARNAAMLYAPPVRSPWWERLLSSRAFLYAVAFCLLAVPVAGFAAAAVLGRRREERDLALYD